MRKVYLSAILVGLFVLQGIHPVLSMRFEQKAEDVKDETPHSVTQLFSEATDKILDFSSWQDLTDETLKAAISMNPCALKLNLQGCTRLTDTGFYFIAKNLTQLEEIDLTGCSQLTPIARHL